MSDMVRPPRFSIVTVTRNDLAGLKQTHSSIEVQSCSDYEWIIVDGGSTDGTVEHLGCLNRRNYKWTSAPDHGLYDAMNKGLSRATGRHVIFMNSGDRFWRPDVLERIHTLLTEYGDNWDLLFGDSFEETADGKLRLKAARPVGTITYKMFTHHQAMVYSHRAIAGMRFDCSFRVASDYDFTCRVLARGGRTFRLEFPVCIFKRGGFSESEEMAELGRRELLAIQKQVLRLGPMRRTCNYGLFLASSLMRTHMQDLHDRIFRRMPPAA